MDAAAARIENLFESFSVLACAEWTQLLRELKIFESVLVPRKPPPQQLKVRLLDETALGTHRRLKVRKRDVAFGARIHKQECIQ